MLCAVARGLWLGPEAVAQGSIVYRARELGAFLGGIALGARAHFGFRAGVKSQVGQPTVGTFSVERAAGF